MTQKIEVGVDSFAAMMPDPIRDWSPSPRERMANLLDEVVTADKAGLDAFGVGEHHRSEFIDSAPAIILAAAAARTSRIRLHSAVSVLGAADPVRIFQDFATLDLVSDGRAEIVAGRGSSVDAYPLFGFDLRHYDDLFAEKIDLLLKLGDAAHIHWQGRHRPSLSGQGVYPRPIQPRLPIWLGVGGTPQSFARAGTLGLPLMVAIIGGSFDRFRPLVDLYREAGRQAGHDPERLKVGLHAVGFVGPTDQEARDRFFPGWHHMFSTLGRERGWPPATRAQFDGMCGPEGVFLIGSPRSVAAKMLATAKTLGGLSRINLQMSSASGTPEAMLESIHLLGAEVKPYLDGFIAIPAAAENSAS